MTYAKHFVPVEDLPNLIPAAFADKPAEHVSENYQFVRTADILQPFFDEGWGVMHACQQKVRSEEKNSETKHKIILAPNMDIAALELGGLLPTINWVNSNDWSSRVEAMFGMMRLACTNGLIVKGAQFMQFSVRHDNIHEDIQTIMAQFRFNANQMLDTANAWNEITLDRQSQNTLAMAAARIRFGDEANSDHADSLLIARRSIDAEPTLWNIFNRIQENATKGGVKVGSMKRKSRKITNIRKDISINTELFDLVNTFALSL